MRGSPFECYFAHVLNKRVQLRYQAVKCNAKGKLSQTSRKANREWEILSRPHQVLHQIKFFVGVAQPCKHNLDFEPSI